MPSYWVLTQRNRTSLSSTSRRRLTIRYYELINTYHSDRFDTPIALVATKIDLLKNDHSSLDGPSRIAAEKGWLFHKTSAKDNIGVNELFDDLICKHFHLQISPPKVDNGFMFDRSDRERSPLLKSTSKLGSRQLTTIFDNDD